MLTLNNIRGLYRTKKHAWKLAQKDYFEIALQLAGDQGDLRSNKEIMLLKQRLTTRHITKDSIQAYAEILAIVARLWPDNAPNPHQR